MKNSQVALVTLGLAVGALLATSPLLRASGDIALGALVLLALCVAPIALWIKRGMHGIPAFEMFAGMHLAYYWLPAGRPAVGPDYSDGIKAQAIWVICLFLGVGMFVYYWLMKLVARRLGLRADWMDYKLGTPGRAVWAWIMLYSAFGFELLVQTGLIWHLVSWSIYRPVQTTFSAFAMLGTFALAVHFGVGAMNKIDRSIFLGLLGMLMALYVVSGFLGAAATTAAVAGIGFMLGSKRIPFFAFAVCLAIGSFLNLGKLEWRKKHWNTNEQASISTRFADFLELSFQAVADRFNNPTTDEQGSATMLERAAMIEVIQRTILLTPETIPYGGGKTYRYGLSLLVPKLLNPERGDIHQAMTEIAWTYGYFQDFEAASKTNISIGPIAEAWISGGWLVVGMAGAGFGAFFAMGSAMAWGRTFDTVGYMSGAFFFSMLVPSMELLSGATFMAFTRNYFMALVAMLTFAYRQGLLRNSDVLNKATPFEESSPRIS